MNEPSSLTSAIAEELSELSAQSPARTVLAAMLEGHHRNQRRRLAVLSHEDLRKRLQCHPLNFSRADRWNGYIPPATICTGEDEILRSARIVKDGTLKIRYNQLGKRTIGEIPNDSAQRAALIEISTEAWQREQET